MLEDVHKRGDAAMVEYAAKLDESTSSVLWMTQVPRVGLSVAAGGHCAADH